MGAARTINTDFMRKNKTGQIMCYKTGQFYLLTTYTGYGVQMYYYNLIDGRGLCLVATNGPYAGIIDLYH